MKTSIQMLAVASMCTVAAGCGSIGGIAAGFPPSEVALAATAGRTLTTEELQGIYENRTWLWDDGAGYFNGPTGPFTAAARLGRKEFYAEGDWFIKKPGRMCFQATWSAADGSADALTCFDHRRDEQRIYQRRAPFGEWYVFSHVPPVVGDEILELRSGDYVRRTFGRNRDAILSAPSL